MNSDRLRTFLTPSLAKLHSDTVSLAIIGKKGKSSVIIIRGKVRLKAKRLDVFFCYGLLLLLMMMMMV